MSFASRKTAKQSRDTNPYRRFSMIDGSHPIKDSVPGGYVAYHVKKRPHGKVAFFNFGLAKEMGLIPANHDEKLTTDLERMILDTFALQIINEHDIMHESSFLRRKFKPEMYMATRYLQMQHKSRTGLTSGDGRSIWNGTISYRGKSWDISSCGTGATCLSPATGNTGVFFKSGDPSISYGCGYAELSEGLTNAIFSEIIYHNNIPSERTLVVIEFPQDTCISVRAAPNLIRPSHFFLHLKQGRLDRLKPVVDLFIKRQVENGIWKFSLNSKKKYQYFLENFCDTFAQMCARFEREYIFCWLDWDGDNILADGSIIDYGSIRQFGLFHHEYRFDDVERWSTNIKEQRLKARYTVQLVAQMVDFIVRGEKKSIDRFTKHSILKRFDQEFEYQCRRMLLRQIGFDESNIDEMLKRGAKLVRDFETVFKKFERTKSKRGYVEVGDGLSWNAVFCMRDILRVLPAHLQETGSYMTDREFIDTIKSHYASRSDCKLTPTRRRDIQRYQEFYDKLLRLAMRVSGQTSKQVLADVVKRAAVINRFDRITGDGMAFVGMEVVKRRKNLDDLEFYNLVQGFIKRQTLVPESHDWSLVEEDPEGLSRRGKSLWRTIVHLVQDYREGI